MHRQEGGARGRLNPAASLLEKVFMTFKPTGSYCSSVIMMGPDRTAIYASLKAVQAVDAAAYLV